MIYYLSVVVDYNISNWLLALSYQRTRLIKKTVFSYRNANNKSNHQKGIDFSSGYTMLQYNCVTL